MKAHRLIPDGGSAVRSARAATVGCIAAAVAVFAAVAVAAPADRGASLAREGAGQAAACASCHGAAGEGNAAAGFPRLAGVPARYLARQLDDFAAGRRRSAVMAPIAQALSPQDREAASAYYARLPAPAAARAASAPAADPAAAELASRGRWSQTLPACEQCHAPGGRGVGDDFPPLAGQPAAYLAAQLRAWKDGSRPPGPLGLMSTIARKLSDRDIDALARHFASLPASGARP
ncbi:MAG: c-type cytochrome [Pseudomonadota bacterium]